MSKTGPKVQKRGTVVKKVQKRGNVTSLIIPILFLAKVRARANQIQAETNVEIAVAKARANVAAALARAHEQLAVAQAQAEANAAAAQAISCHWIKYNKIFYFLILYRVIQKKTAPPKMFIYIYSKHHK